MTGTGNTTKFVSASGDQRIDGILYNRAWADSTISFSTPTSVDDYGTQYGSSEHLGFVEASTEMANALASMLNLQSGNAANDGFSLEGFTNLNVVKTTGSGAHIRLAQTSSDPYNSGTAWAYFPNYHHTAGDIWTYNQISDYTKPVSGNYANLTLLHELGHALGLLHGHDTRGYGAVPRDYDAMEYSVMTYRSYIGSPGDRLYNEPLGMAQSFMMLDIAALQYMYGADYTTNSGDTIYSWSPETGQTLVDGGVGISPGANRIFATIWDGGGIDVYDLSAYSANLNVSLEAGGFSAFGTAQLARVGPGIYAQGNIYNALLADDDKRSLIENAIGGSGNDLLTGNGIDNRLDGGRGNDKLVGRAGSDRLQGQDGDDLLIGNAHADYLRGGTGHDEIFGGSGADSLFGNGGNDILKAGAGDDRLIGGYGTDNLSGQDGNDVFVFRAVGDSLTGVGRDTILDFESDADLIDLSALAEVPLTFHGKGAFSGDGASVIIRNMPDGKRVLVDVDGDEVADMRIDVVGVQSLHASDFLL